MSGIHSSRLNAEIMFASPGPVNCSGAFIRSYGERAGSRQNLLSNRDLLTKSLFAERCSGLRPKYDFCHLAEMITQKRRAFSKGRTGPWTDCCLSSDHRGRPARCAPSAFRDLAKRDPPDAPAADHEMEPQHPR